MPLRASGALDEDLIPEHLDRLGAIEADLESLRPRRSSPELGPVPATTAYADRIREAGSSPARFLGHHYVRYLGDLSGGQAMRVWLDRRYGLPEESAAFFRFDGVDSPVRFKKAYRAALDRWQIGDVERADLFSEAIEGFAANSRVFTALDTRPREAA